MKCRCGCGFEAAWIVESEDFDGPFREHCCELAMVYMSEASFEFGVSFKKERIASESQLMTTWNVQGECRHPLCRSNKLNRPEMGRRVFCCGSRAEAETKLRGLEIYERRCGECRRPIAKRHFEIVEKS